MNQKYYAMKQTLLIVSFFIYLFFISSCSELKEVIQEPSVVQPESTLVPATKAFLEMPDCADIAHCIQSDHIVMLINSVAFRDSIYVQTLTQRDMADLGITKAERALCEEYLFELNKKNNDR